MVVCTKLVQWLAVIAVFMEVWYGLISGWMGIQLSTPVSEALIPVRPEMKRLSRPTHHVMLFVVVVVVVVVVVLQLPLYMVMCFGVSRQTCVLSPPSNPVKKKFQLTPFSATPWQQLATDS